MSTLRVAHAVTAQLMTRCEPRQMSGRSCVHVLSVGDGWAVRSSGAKRAVKICATQIEAITLGRRIATKRRCELIVNRPDGSIRSKDWYGEDPFPPLMETRTTTEIEKVRTITPDVALLCKLSAFVVHAEEWFAEHHEYDLIALRDVLLDPDVREWVDGMTKLALAPVKRNA
mgnify:CR=1 FL=1